MKKFLVPMIAAAAMLLACEGPKTVSFLDVEVDYPADWDLFYENPQEDNDFISITKAVEDSTYFGEVNIAIFKDADLAALTDPEEITDYLVSDAYIFADSALPNPAQEDIVYTAGLTEDTEFSYDIEKEPYQVWCFFEGVYNGKPYFAEVCSIKLGEYEVVAFAQGENEEEIEEYLKKTFDTARLK